MSASIWFNARVLCLEEEPYLSATLKEAKARLKRVEWRTDLDWANPDLPYAMVEGHDVVLLEWPREAAAPEHIRWWLSACLHLFESARRSRVKALGLVAPAQAEDCLGAAGVFLRHYLLSLQVTGFVAEERDELLRAIGAHYA